MVVRPTVLALLLACSPSKQPEPAAIATPSQAEAARAAKDWQRCAQLWLAIAATTRGEATIAPLYDAACCQAQAGDRDAAFATLARAVAAGLDEPTIEDDIDLAPLHADARWPQLLATLRAQRAKAAASVAEPELRTELLMLAASTADQTPRLREIVAMHGWPGKSLVGKDGAHAAWRIIQGSRDAAFQETCLEKLELAVAQGEAQPIEHAYLYDRVAVNAGKPQRWGTQFDGTEPYPIEDAARVDERRKAIGLPTLAEHQRYLRDRD